MMEKIFEIEEKYPSVGHIKFRNQNVWPIYRMVLRHQLLLAANQRFNQHPVKSSPLRTFRNFLRDLVSLIAAIAGFLKKLSQWTAHYEYVVFSNDLERKQLGNTMVDKLATGLINMLGEKNTLLVNYPSYPRKSQKNFRPQKNVDGSIINLVARFMIRRQQLSAQDTGLIGKIIHEYQLGEDGWSAVGTILNKIKVLNFLFSRWRPKAVFICCYSYYAECYAANSHGIKTIELQHGFIGPQHPAYQSRLKIDRSYSSQHLLTFGENSIRGLGGNVVALDRVRPIGNFYIEKMSSTAPDPKLRKLLGDFKTSICVPTDYITENEIIDFILRVAIKKPEFLFLIVPRLHLNPEIAAKTHGLNNIRIVVEFDFQNIVRHCTHHTCTLSTCCLEALSLGVPNILINTEGRPFEMYGEILEPAYSRFVSTSEEFIKAVGDLGHCSRQDIIHSNQLNFANHYQFNMGNALREILPWLGEQTSTHTIGTPDVS